LRYCGWRHAKLFSYLIVLKAVEAHLDDASMLAAKFLEHKTGILGLGKNTSGAYLRCTTVGRGSQAKNTLEAKIIVPPVAGIVSDFGPIYKVGPTWLTNTKSV
jgi:hypothetical protein